MANITAQRCFTQHALLLGPPLIQNGHLVLQPHNIGWIVAGIFTIVAVAVSFWLISKHLMWYTKKRQQRYIVRLLLMVPVYAIVSLASYIFWNHALPLTLLRDSYESFVLYSFFYLLLQYLSPTTEGQKDVFRNIVLEKWIFPLGSIKYRPRDGLYFLQLMKWGVLQYCVVRPTTTLVAVILDFIGLYCDSSWSPAWGHIYITIVVSLSVTIAMYCLFQLYIPISEQLASKRPLLKLFSVKAVVFLTFWQATALSTFSMFGVVKDTPYMTANDINTGIAALLETFEMMCFAVLHIRAFSYMPYCPDGERSSDRTSRIRSLMHALDIRDMWREVREGSVYMGKTIRGVEADNEARRKTHFAKVMGREREFNEPKEDWPIGKYLYDEEFLLEHHEREGYNRKGVWSNETGATSEDEVQRRRRTRELDGGYGLLHEPALDDVEQGHTRGNNSWRKRIYDRISQSEFDKERLSPIPWRPTQQHRRNRLHPSRVPSLESPPPPPFVMYEYSSLENGHFSLRLHRNQLTMTPNHLSDPLVDHNQNSCAGHSDMEDLTFCVRERDLIDPQPLLIPDSPLIEPVVSSKHSESSTVLVPRNDQEGGLFASGITRSDSLLMRIFPNPTPTTAAEHMSSGGRSNSQVTYFSPIPFTVPPPQTPLEHVPLRRPRGPQKHFPPKRRLPRPPIVLPTPLSPARYSAVEMLRRMPEQSSLPSVGRHSSQELRRSGRNNTSSLEPSRFVSTTSAQLGRFSHALSNKHETLAARHSDHIAPRESLATTPLFAPKIDPIILHGIISMGTRNTQAHFSPQSHDVDHGDVALSRNMSSELSMLPPSSMRTTRISTTPPSPSISPHQLRHTRGDVGAVKKSWT